MSEKPILFNTEMVRAILDGRKSCTRRVVKKAIPFNESANCWNILKKGEWSGPVPKCKLIEQCAPYQIGDILYVRETWNERYGDGTYIYRADDKLAELPTFKEPTRLIYHPSIHMPKAAARIWLKVTDVRVERLQDITEDEAKAEGIGRLYDHMSKEEYEKWSKQAGLLQPQEECSFINYLWHGNFGENRQGKQMSDSWIYQYSGYKSAIGSFSSLWNKTIGFKNWNKYGWDANPWVWVIEFERCENPGKEI